MKLSRDVKESIKTALAMTIAYAISLEMDWDRPYWAGFAVAFISLPTIGQSLNKGVLRMGGTVLGTLVALIVLSFAAQERWLFITLVSLWCGLCTYAMGGSRHQYFWHVSGFVFLIICVDGGPYPDDIFSIASLRFQQTILGISVYSLVAIFLWPKSTRKQLESTATSLLDNQAALFSAYSKELLEDVVTADRKEIYGQIMSLESQFAVSLEAAASDTEEVRDLKPAWYELLQSNSAFSDTLQQWREGFGDLTQLDLRQIFPEIEVFTDEVEARFKAIEAIRAGESVPQRTERIKIDAEDLQGLSHFQRAAVSGALSDLRKLDELSMKMLRLWQVLYGGSSATSLSSPPVPRPPSPFRPDLDRMVAAGRLMLAMWLAFLAVIYITDIPGGLALLVTVGPPGMMLFNSPQIPIRTLYPATAFGIFFGGALYIFVMPHLSSFAGLGAMMFLGTFFLCLRFSSPSQALGRTLGLAMFLQIISVSNQQSYSFLGVTTTALLWTLFFLLYNIVSQIPFSLRPEKTIVRLMKRYFASASYLMAFDAKSHNDSLNVFGKSFHQHEVSTLPEKLHTWADKAQPEVLGADSVQQLATLLSRLHALSFRIYDLQEARELTQSAQIGGYFRDDMLAWRDRVVNIMQDLSRDPARGTLPDRSLLDKRLLRLEQQIQTCLDRVDLEPHEQDNFYRLLGAYRGVSHALLDCMQEAAKIDWQTWEEERFA